MQTFACVMLLSLSRSLAVASDPLEAWTNRASNVTAVFNNIVYGGRLLVAVGSGGAIVSSPDGVEWTPQFSGVQASLYAIAYGDGTYVAVGANGTIVSSPDADFWTPQDSKTTASLYGVAYGNGVFVAAGGSTVSVSSNGIDWVAITTPALTGANMNDITFGGGRFMGVGASTNAMTSTDGLVWERTGPVPPALFAVLYGAGKYVAVGGGFGSQSLIAYSSDGRRWNTNVLNTTLPLVDIACGNGLFVVVGLTFFGPTTVWSSSNGMSWTAHTLTFPQTLYGVGYGNSTFVAIGANGYIAQSGSYAPAQLRIVNRPGINDFLLEISGERGRTYRLEAASDLATSNWQALVTFKNAAGTTFIRDSTARRSGERFYRVVSP